jgi:3'(2'), 5'-bisphosphate nucleotidase
MPYGRELEAALAAADLAGAVILDHYAHFAALTDAPASISTAADRASQEAILRHLRAQFPGDAFCAEEDTPGLAGVPRTGPRLWVIDPIDGTRGFATKNGEFSVMIAFVHKGRVAAGAVTEPANGRRTCAARGGGCWSRDGGGEARAVRVSAVTELAASTLTQSHTKPGRGPTLPVRRLVPARVIETYSAGVKLAQVARGEADLYVCTYDRLHDWDLAAGHILVDEAGGRATDLNGGELSYGRQPPVHLRGVMASNGVTHAAALNALRARDPAV